MTKTTNYQLNQWAKSDRIMMDDFNADNQKIDAALAAGPKIAVGAYDGQATNLPYNGYQIKTIELGFRAKLLLITTGSSFNGATSAMLIDDMNITNSSGDVLTQITDEGFTVGSAKFQNDTIYPDLNNLYQHYHYVAIG